VNLDAIAKTVLGTGKAPEPVTIKIPSDHPAAPALRHLFASLATEERTRSGIYVKKSGPNNGALREMLNALRDVLAQDGIDLDEKARDVLNFQHPQPIEGIMQNPLMMSQLIMGAFGGEAPVSPQVREHHMKRAEEMMRKMGDGDSI
jgi:hypothetical protein